MNKLFYLSIFSLLLSISPKIFAMENNEYLPSMDASSYDHDLLAIKKACKKKCSSLDDSCTEVCRQEAALRVANYFHRKYTQICQGRTFEERFPLNPTHEEKAKESMDTDEADKILKKYPIIEDCVNRYMLNDFMRICQSL